MENLVGYAKDDLLVPLELEHDPWADGLAGLNARAADWCAEVNTTLHSEICAIPAERLDAEREFESWGRFLPEHTTAVSMLDRLLHHCHTVVTDGDSYRMKQARAKGGTRLSTS